MDSWMSGLAPLRVALVRTWRQLSIPARDAILATAAGTLVFCAALVEHAQAAPLVLAGLTAGVSAPLLLRRSYPLTVALASGAVAVAGMAVPGWSGKLVAIAAFGSAAYHGRRPALVYTASATWFVGFGMAIPVKPGGAAAFSEMVLAGIAPVAVGHALRLSRKRAEQAARLHHIEANLVVAEERNRVARDVHDAVGHHLTAIRMQAGAARHVRVNTTSAARHALDTITELASTALQEVRELLRNLRENSAAGGRLSDIEAIPARLSTEHCRVTVDWRGSRQPLPALVEHGGYRLVQEAVTNAVRHARAREVQVLINRDSHGVTIVVEDDGPGSPSDGSTCGGGIRGMRERAGLLDGELNIVARQPHGWRVEATLPVETPQP